MQNRNIGLCILFSFLSCGIYALYWLVKLTDELNTLAGEEDDTSGLLSLVFTLITCGLYGIWWYYKMGTKCNKVTGGDSNHILFLVLGLFGLGLVDYCIIQDTLNKQSGTAATQDE